MSARPSFMFRLALIGLAVVTAMGCEDSDPLLFQEPAQVSVLDDSADDELAAYAGRSLERVPTFVVLDADGLPVPDESVTFSVSDGHGEVFPEELVTDGDGRASPDQWILGDEPGEHRLVAEVQGAEPAEAFAVAELTPSERLRDLYADVREGRVGEPASHPPAVRLTDPVGEPVSDVAIQFALLDDAGELSESKVVTDEDGVAQAEAWILGTRSETQALEASLAEGEEEVESVDFEVEPLRLELEAEPGPPETVEATSEVSQVGLPTFDVLDVPSVRVRDAFDNPIVRVPVHFSLAQGEGRLEDAHTLTDEDGIAHLGGWVPELPGTHVLEASVESETSQADPVSFEVTALDDFHGIEQVQLNQGSQTPDGRIPGVAGRPGLLRVVPFLDLPEGFDLEVSTSARIELFWGETRVRDQVVSIADDSVAGETDLFTEAVTWDLPLEGDVVRSDLGVRVTMDPDSTLDIPHLDTFVYPAEGEVAPLNIQELPPLRVVGLPIHVAYADVTSDVDEENIDDQLVDAYRWIPAPDVEATVREPFTTDHDLSDRDGWSALLSDVRATRISEPSVNDEYFHAFVPSGIDGALGGLAYVAYGPESPSRAAVSREHATSTIAHELGHNMGRRHVPCGGAPNAIDDFPYPDGIIGSPGYDILDGGLVTPDDHFDYLGYCGPRWTSDYKYEKLFDWRLDDPLAPETAPSMAARAAPTPPKTSSLLVWGRITTDGPILEPAFVLETPEHLPASEGPNRLRLRGRDGHILREISFQGTEVSHPRDDERHFAFAIPLGGINVDDLRKVEVKTPVGTASRTVADLPDDVALAADVPALGDPEVAFETIAPDRGRLEWAAERHPAALVRDARTGRILAIPRSGEVRLPMGEASHFEIHVSDGVRSHVVDHR